MEEPSSCDTWKSVANAPIICEVAAKWEVRPDGAYRNYPGNAPTPCTGHVHSILERSQRSNVRLVVDITYLPVLEGTRYLNTIEELYNEILAHVTGEQQDTKLCMDTVLKLARRSGNAIVDGWSFIRMLVRPTLPLITRGSWEPFVLQTEQNVSAFSIADYKIKIAVIVSIIKKILIFQEYSLESY